MYYRYIIILKINKKKSTKPYFKFIHFVNNVLDFVPVFDWNLCLSVLLTLILMILYCINILSISYHQLQEIRQRNSPKYFVIFNLQTQRNKYTVQYSLQPTVTNTIYTNSYSRVVLSLCQSAVTNTIYTRRRIIKVSVRYQRPHDITIG